MLWFTNGDLEPPYSVVLLCVMGFLLLGTGFAGYYSHGTPISSGEIAFMAVGACILIVVVPVWLIWQKKLEDWDNEEMEEEN